MLEDVMDVFIERIRKKVLANQKMNEIPLAYLMTLDIPQSIKHFFDQEVELWIREEEEKFTSSDRFDYDLPEVRVLIDRIFDILKQTARFTIPKFNQLLERAVKLQMNFVIEPHRTLTQFLFKDSNIISTIEVYDTLKYFFQFEYYKEAISDYFNNKYMKEISQDQFVTLINKIDEKVFAENRVEMTLKVIKTIMNFLSEARGTEVTSLSADVLLAALKDRNLHDLVKRFESAQQQIQLSEFSFDEIESILFGRFEEALESPAEKLRFEDIESIEQEELRIEVDDIEVGETPLEQQIADAVEELEKVDEKIGAPELETDDIEEEEDEEEFEEEEEELEHEEMTTPEKDFELIEEPAADMSGELIEGEPLTVAEEPGAEEESFSIVEEPVESEPQPEVEEQPAEPQAPVEEPMLEQPSEPEPVKTSKVADDLADHLARQISGEGPLQDLHTMIKGRTRKKIIKKLFRKDEKTYNEFIDRLNAMSSWKEASHFIDDTFYELNINPYSKEAITFSDIVYMRFFPKDKYIGQNLEEDKFD
ncbi:hypothetical protein ACX8XN_10915 [Calditrichota bacterium GD2]